MRLKHLELQGYKTFASRTGFIFDSGITAVVGPNGSGKSNIADAIRWVLGEQSYRTLRGKRTEDMIFSGSAQRARLGMASASMTFDNADSWLPIEFSEVTITRRAYRSGENEYLLNGSRVRLRDITELLAKSGLARRTYTVIGQGLVDAVLSLRADDRRALFEEAAGITLYQAKRADALSRLEETRSNLLRVNDIINEIAPRLRRLEREAERAEHHALLTRQLEGQLRTWYGYQWRQEQRNLLRTRDALNRREARVIRRRQDLENLDDRVAVLRTRQGQLREQLAAWHKESSELRGQLEEVQRDLAVWRERARLLARRRDEVLAELAELEVQAQALGERIVHAEGEVEGARETLQQKESAAAKAQASLDTHEEQRASMAGQVADGQSRLLDLATRLGDRRNRLAQLDERRNSLAQERDEHRSVIAELEAAAGELRSRIQGLEAEQTRLQSENAALEAEAAQVEETRRKTEEQQDELRGSLAEAQRILERLQARHDSLTRLRQEGEGLHAGVRSLVQSSHKLPGIIGTVVQLLQVPAEYEVAIEVALGGHLQDLVVASWADAEKAIAFLREGRRGRATLLPLDTVRPVQRLELPEVPGLVGVAADLVQAEGRLAPVVEMLLGRTFVTVDLKAARRAFEQFKGGFQIVTLAGEVLRSSGSVTGGQGQSQAQGQVLAREREWRELPGQIAGNQRHCQEIQDTLDKAVALGEETRTQLAALAARARELDTALDQAASGRRDLERDAEGLAAQRTWRLGMVSQLDREAGELDGAERSFREELERLSAEKDRVEGEIAAAQAELDGLRGEALYQRLSEARTAEAIARGRWENRQAALDSLRQGESQLKTQIEAKRQRVTELDAEQSSLSQQIGSQASRERVILGWLSSLAHKVDPAEEEVASLEGEREELEMEEGSLRSYLREAESGYSEALLAHNRQEDRLERLRRQIMDDFGLVDMEPTEGLAEQRPLPMGELVSYLPMVEILPEGLEDDIHQIKAQLRRMGAVNPGAPDEYSEVLDRYTFLTTQATDLEEAATSLREVIAELDDLMRREFLATFELVAARFRENFTQLFGGGTARLILTDTEDVSLTGVDIVARPPGKRQQTLALLSGGERSLTAVALIFALLEVSPPPFCVLDEVDAMLDEANVKRFRDALQSLSESTQFIVITHNRGTIQAADTIYGVSMGNDSVSQVVSLRLEGDRIAAPDGSVVDVMKEG
ncbi:MAG: chromosome segregation protein SMC [Anaerolineae bacterium]